MWYIVSAQLHAAAPPVFDKTTHVYQRAIHVFVRCQCTSIGSAVSVQNGVCNACEQSSTIQLREYLQNGAGSSGCRFATWQGFPKAGLGQNGLCSLVGLHSVGERKESGGGSPLGPTPTLYEEHLQACRTAQSVLTLRNRLSRGWEGEEGGGGGGGRGGGRGGGGKKEEMG